MPDIIPDMLNQTLVYWTAGSTNRYGNIVYSEPQELPCRWEDFRQVMTDSEGKQFLSTGKIYLAAPVALRGYVFEGTLDDLPDNFESPGHSKECFEVRIFRSIPDLDDEETLYMAYC